jgi:hypothetical protein
MYRYAVLIPKSFAMSAGLMESLSIVSLTGQKSNIIPYSPFNVCRRLLKEPRGHERPRESFNGKFHK